MMFDMTVFLGDRPLVMRVGFGDQPEDFLHDLIERLNGVARGLLQLIRLEEKSSSSSSAVCSFVPFECDVCYPRWLVTHVKCEAQCGGRLYTGQVLETFGVEQGEFGDVLKKRKNGEDQA